MIDKIEITSDNLRVIIARAFIMMSFFCSTGSARRGV